VSVHKEQAGVSVQITKMNKAIFLDRDGVINYPVLNSKTNEHEAPSNDTDFKLYSGVIEGLKELQKQKYKLFLVSNQPDYAKGKTTLENLRSVHEEMHSIFIKNNILFSEYYYCYHHPNGVIPEYSYQCKCRKPENLFLTQAKIKYDLDFSKSWMVGDSDIDIFCGQSTGVKTILVKTKESSHRTGKSVPEHVVNNLQEAVEVIKREHNTGDTYAKH